MLLQQPLVDYYEEDYEGSDYYYQESEPLYEASSSNSFVRRSFQVPEERQLFPELPDITSILLLITTTNTLFIISLHVFLLLFGTTGQKAY